MARELIYGTPGFAEDFARLLDDKRETAADVNAAVAAIIEGVRQRGDAALVDYSNRFDRTAIDASRLAIGRAEVDAAVADCSGDTVAALELAAKRIEEFHRCQKPEGLNYTDAAGSGWATGGRR